MRRIATLRSLSLLLLLLALVPTGASASPSSADIWSEFVSLMQAGSFPAERVRPYREELRESLLGFLSTMQDHAEWSEWAVEPDVYELDDRVHFVTDLSFAGDSSTYCFSFVTDDDEWFFQHLETITLRLDDLGPTPVTEFPDVPEPTKAWIRAELEVSRDVWFYRRLSQEKGAEAALDWFRDGTGYALAAQSWVPFVRPSEAFVLYLCWEQSQLSGNEVVLEGLNETEALVRVKPLYFLLYERTGHLHQQIERDDYVRLYEFRWEDRATHAGWDVEFEYEGPWCNMHFSQEGDVAPPSNERMQPSPRAAAPRSAAW
jgi:hypothetical protein